MIITPLVTRRRRGTLVKGLVLVGLAAALVVVYSPALEASCDPPGAGGSSPAAEAAGGIVVVSAGPDGQLATADDIRVASRDRGRAACR